MPSATRALAAGMTAGLAAAGGYAGVVRPWMLHWGATAGEACRPLPGDDVVARPRYQQTHAVTIEAPPTAVWPWLVQLGQGRGGLYSYDWLENLVGCDIHSADRIIPGLQRLDPGDVIRLVPEDWRTPLWLRVAEVQPERALVLTASGDRPGTLRAGLPWPSWAFVLEPEGQDATRLIVRWRSDFEPTLAGRLANKYLLEPVHFVMERRMLLGIRQRAERGHEHLTTSERVERD
jgi:hypothetical protein